MSRFYQWLADFSTALLRLLKKYNSIFQRPLTNANHAQFVKHKGVKCWYERVQLECVFLGKVILVPLYVTHKKIFSWPILPYHI